MSHCIGIAEPLGISFQVDPGPSFIDTLDNKRNSHAMDMSLPPRMSAFSRPCQRHEASCDSCDSCRIQSNAGLVGQVKLLNHMVAIAL